jgi:LEA14-like dessication related protein
MQVHVWAFIFLITAAALLSGCSFLFKDPEISVEKVTPVSFSLNELILAVTLNVTNPNSMGITLKNLSFDVYYQKGTEWVYLSHGEQQGIRINPGENEVTVPVTIQTSALAGSLLDLVTSGEITLQIRGVASPDLGVISPKVPFTRTMTYPLKTLTDMVSR